MPPAALLMHRTPDGGSHYDWLLAPEKGPHEPDEPLLWCWRLAARIDRADPDSALDAERIADHRWLYLTFEGELTAGRGSVERVAAGVWSSEAVGPDRITGTIRWESGAAQRFDGLLIDGARWRFQISGTDRR